LSVQTSLEHGDANQVNSGERHTTADLDTQLTLHPLPRHEVITGVTYRSTSDHLRSSQWYKYDTPSATTSFVGAFVQDEITLVPERVTLTLGTKIERNSYSGWEMQPSLRLLWRAARTPSRTERGIEWNAATLPPTPDLPLPGKLIALGAPDFSSEHVTAFEAGHRYQPSKRFSIDTSLFYSEYNDLRGLRPEVIPPDFTAPPIHYVYRYYATNNLTGNTHGGEISVRWQASSILRFDGSLALVRTSLAAPAGSPPDDSIGGLIGNTPREEYKFHAAWDFSPTWALDLFARQTGRLTESGAPPYTGLDARISWRPRTNLEIELVGRDLLDPYHPEISGFFLGNEVQQIARSVFFRTTYKF
jgi:iron complex outermembrane receptor protein